MNLVFEEMAKKAENMKESYKESPYYILYKIIDAFYDKTLKSLAISSQKLLDIQTNIGKN